MEAVDAAAAAGAVVVAEEVAEEVVAFHDLQEAVVAEEAETSQEDLAVVTPGPPVADTRALQAALHALQAAVLRARPEGVPAARVHLAGAANPLHPALPAGAVRPDLRNVLPAAATVEEAAVFPRLGDHNGPVLAAVVHPQEAALRNCRPRIVPGRERATVLRNSRRGREAALLEVRDSGRHVLVQAPGPVPVPALERELERGRATCRHSVQAAPISVISSGLREVLRAELLWEVPWRIVPRSYQPIAPESAIDQGSVNARASVNARELVSARDSVSARRSVLSSAPIGRSAPRIGMISGSSESITATRPGTIGSRIDSRTSMSFRTTGINAGTTWRALEKTGNHGATRTARTGRNIEKNCGITAGTGPTRSGITPKTSMMTCSTITGGARSGGVPAMSMPIPPIRGGGGPRLPGAPSRASSTWLPLNLCTSTMA